MNDFFGAPDVLVQDAYALCLAASNRVRWDINHDVIRGHELDFAHHFLPESMSRVGRLTFLGREDQRLLSQIQGRSYVNMLGLTERFIGAKMVELSGQHALGDQTAFEALVGFTGEELKHQELFRRIEMMADDGMPYGYSFLPNPDHVAHMVLSRSSWAVLALICHIELFTQVHYRASILPDQHMSPLFKDVLHFHWKEEAQHALLDETEWAQEDLRLSPEQRDAALGDLIELVDALDKTLRLQAQSDAAYFAQACHGGYVAAEHDAVRAGLIKAYRWQYIFSGVQSSRFMDLLSAKLTDVQMRRVAAAVTPLWRAPALVDGMMAMTIES